MIRKYLIKTHNKARLVNNLKIMNMLEINSNAELLDMGCDDGNWTMELAKKIQTQHINGIEVVESRILNAQSRGIEVVMADLNSYLPYPNDHFDVIHANQVIEHLNNTDNFVSEIYRLLKPGGYAIISTENLSSWHNIIALIFGWQPFSMANFSKKGNIGNPFSLWKREISNNSSLLSWQHNRLFSYYGLKDLFQKFNFKVEKIKTSGYYPFFEWFSKIDPIHGHYIVYKIRK